MNEWHLLLMRLSTLDGISPDEQKAIWNEGLALKNAHDENYGRWVKRLRDHLASGARFVYDDQGNIPNYDYWLSVKGK